MGKIPVRKAMLDFLNSDSSWALAEIAQSYPYDAVSGLPYCLKGNENKIFIDFVSGGKYLAPFGMTILLAPNPKKFTDISTLWAKSYIDFVTERELFMRTATNVFSPDTGMTRAMFATVIGRLYERSYGQISTSKNHTFMDCQYHHYYGKYVDSSAGNGIIEVLYVCLLL